MRNHEYRKAESIEMRNDIERTPSVWIGLLGPLEARVDGRTVDFAQQEGRLLVALLSAEAGPVPRSKAEEWVWDDEPRRTDALGEVVAALRRKFVVAGAPDLIVARGGLLRFEVSGLSTDLNRFRALAGEAEHRPPAEQYDLLKEAMQLVRGEPFATVRGTKGIDGYREILQGEIRLARIRFLEVSAKLGRHSNHMNTIKEEFERDPSNHRLAVLTVAAHYHLGMTQEALAAYSKHERRLTEDGILVRGELQELQRRILQDDPELNQNEEQHMNEPDEKTATAPADQPAGVTNNIGRQTVNGPAINGNSTGSIYFYARPDTREDSHE